MHNVSPYLFMQYSLPDPPPAPTSIASGTESNLPEQSGQHPHNSPPITQHSQFNPQYTYQPPSASPAKPPPYALNNPPTQPYSETQTSYNFNSQPQYYAYQNTDLQSTSRQNLNPSYPSGNYNQQQPSQPIPQTLHPPPKYSHNPDHSSYSQTAHSPLNPTDYPSRNLQEPRYPDMPNLDRHFSNSQWNNLKKDSRELNPPAHFVSCSVESFPNSSTLSKRSAIPLGLIFQPLAQIPIGQPEIPCVNFGNAQMIRCKSCQAYLNAFIKWENNGEKWTCNICDTSNSTPSFYKKLRGFSSNNPRLEPIDERPELSGGSFETFASGDHMHRPPQPPSFMFLIDVSFNANQMGLVESACNAIKNILTSKEFLEWSRTKIGIITFDSSIHFYHISNDLSQPQILVVPMNDIFVPLPQEVMVNASDCMKPLMSLLDQLPTIWKDNSSIDTCLGSAIDAAYQSMSKIGGKLSVFFTSIPSIGKFPLTGRSRLSDPQKKFNNESSPLKPIDDSYLNVGTELAHYQISVDLYACPVQSVELPTLQYLSKSSSGNIYYYPNFQQHVHGAKLSNELKHNILSTVGWEALIRFRVSKGLKISRWIGHFHLRSTHLLVIPHLNTDQTFTIFLDHDEEIQPSGYAYVQCATLFTNCVGERKLRVHTYCISVTSDFQTHSNSLIPSTTASLMCQTAVEIAFLTGLSDSRNFLQDRLTSIISSRPTQRSQPIELLIMYVLGILKSTAFRESNEITSDMRVYQLSRLETLTLELQLCYFYPKLLPLHTLNEFPDTLENNQTVIPAALNLTYLMIFKDGAYLLDNGESMTLWIGRSISSYWLQSVFMVDSLEYIYPDYAEATIASSSSILGQKVFMILNELQKSHGLSFLKLAVIRQEDPSEHSFFMSLIEDKTPSMPISLMDFMQMIGYRGYFSN